MNPLIGFSGLRGAGDEIGEQYCMFCLHLALVAAFRVGRDIDFHAGPVVILEGPFLHFVLAGEDAEVNVFKNVRDQCLR